jgi:hypothetical protein
LKIAQLVILVLLISLKIFGLQFQLISTLGSSINFGTKCSEFLQVYLVICTNTCIS